MPRGGECGHPRCYGEPCKQLTPEELAWSAEDLALAEQLASEGWQPESNKARHVRRVKHAPANPIDLIAEAWRDTAIGVALLRQYGSARASILCRLGPQNADAEERTLSVKQYRALKAVLAKRRLDG